MQKLASPMQDPILFPIQHFPSVMTPAGGVFTSQEMVRPIMAPIDHSLAFSHNFSPANLLDSQSMFLQRSLNYPSHNSSNQIYKSCSLGQDSKKSE